MCEVIAYGAIVEAEDMKELIKSLSRYNNSAVTLAFDHSAGGEEKQGFAYLKKTLVCRDVWEGRKHHGKFIEPWKYPQITRIDIQLLIDFLEDHKIFTFCVEDFDYMKFRYHL